MRRASPVPLFVFPACVPHERAMNDLLSGYVDWYYDSARLAYGDGLGTGDEVIWRSTCVGEDVDGIGNGGHDNAGGSYGTTAGDGGSNAPDWGDGDHHGNGDGDGYGNGQTFRNWPNAWMPLCPPDFPGD